MTPTSSTTKFQARDALAMARTDPQLKELIPDPGVTEALNQAGISYAEIIAIALDGYSTRPAMGRRAYTVDFDPGTGRHERRLLSHFETVTYGELHARVKGLASAWRHHDDQGLAPGDFLCVLGFSGIDYATVDMACSYLLGVCVPLQTSLATADIDGIFAGTEPTVVAATVTDLVQAARLAADHASLREVVALDYDERVDDDHDQFTAAQAELARNGSRARLVALDELVSAGRSSSWEPMPPSTEGEERTALIVHSSGSTGTPKGAIIPERIAKFHLLPNGSVPVVRLVFAPMNHLGGRNNVYTTLGRGGTVYFTATTDLSTLFEDIQLTRPTELMFFPRVLEMIQRHFLNEVVRRSGPGIDRQALQTAVLAEMRAGFLGDRICSFGTATAPATPEVKQFVSECFQLPLSEGYGSTEAGPVTSQDRILRPVVVDYRVRDVPELGYFTTDKPYPRGELCVKTLLSSPGYFKRPDANLRLFDDEGFIRTGDIVEEHGPDHVVLIDRGNDVLKLSQGEFVALGAVGSAFENGSDVVHQIYLYGTSVQSYLVAVVVPNMELAEALLGDDLDELHLRNLVRDELRKVATEANLRSFEIPRDFILEAEPFSHENGLLSSVYKRMRPALQAKYKARLEQLYLDLQNRQNEELVALSDLENAMTVLERVVKALEASLGVNNVNLSHGFSDLGGDSLGAAEFSVLLENIFGVPVPASTILSPVGNPRHWADAIEGALARQGSELPTFEAVHGPSARQIRSADLSITRFIKGPGRSYTPIQLAPEVPNRVLLTGATGFLGRFVCLEWLERQAATGGTLTCLVRAAGHPAAQQRLASVFEGGDPLMAARFAELARDHLEVIAGDVGQPRLGLGIAEFDELARTVDRVVHPGALVNHALAYEHLFRPNVAGTAELVRLAVTHRLKPFDFVSSTATSYMIDRSNGVDEQTPLPSTITIANRYANGYGSSKWAAEQLLHSAHHEFGMPLNVFRGDMMLAHSAYHRQINAVDMFTRLLSSIALTGLAPESFYPLAADGTRPRAHYDGLPVDFIAASVVGIAAQSHDEIRTFHVVNHHDDGISLDTFVDWIEIAGYPVQRIRRYGEWVERFEMSLRGLPEHQRQQSSLITIDSLRHPAAGDPVGGSQQFQAAVRGLPVGPEVPHLTQDFIVKCINDMRALGLVPEPASDGA
jgi:fatty acid CoA ligase FadD9